VVELVSLISGGEAAGVNPVTSLRGLIFNHHYYAVEYRNPYLLNSAILIFILTSEMLKKY